MSSSEREARVKALKKNLDAHARGKTKIDPHELVDILNDLGIRWRIAWEEMPRDQVFDNLYARIVSIDKRPFLFRQDPDDTTTHSIIYWDDDTWNATTGLSELLEWLIDCPPRNSVAAISNLYSYARNIERTKSPWVMLAAMTGERKLQIAPHNAGAVVVGDTSVDRGFIQLDELFPIGIEDACYLGAALTTWYIQSDIASAYIHLVDSYDAQLK